MSDVSQVPIDQIDPIPERKPRKRGNGKALAVASEAPAPVHVSEGDAFLMMIERAARDPQVDIDKMERLLDRRERMEAAEARKAFESGMADVRAALTPIVKKHEASFGTGKATYKYEQFADIAAIVDPIFAKHGFSYRFRASSEPNEPIRVTCIIAHRAGHVEETTLSAGADTSGGKNGLHGLGSTLEYLRRYTLRLGAGLATGKDDDGRAAGETPSNFITDGQYQTIMDKIAETQSDTERFCRYMGVEGIAKIPANKYQRAIEALDAKARK